MRVSALRPSWLVAASLLLLCCLLARADAAPTATPRRQILFLVSHQYGLTVPDSFARGAVAALKAQGMSADDIYVEYLDLVRNRTPDYRRQLATLLSHKLAGANIGLVVAQSTQAVGFLEEEGRALFPEAPLFINHPSHGADWHGGPRKLLVMSSVMDIAGTLNQALTLLPATRHVLVVLGRDPDPRIGNDAQVRIDLAPFAARVALEYTNDLSYEEMLRKVAGLPAGTIVLNPTYSADRTGRSFIPAEVSAKVSAAASVPVFIMYDNLVGNGVVGGSVLKSDVLGAELGRMAFDVLSGRARLPDQRTVIAVPHVAMYDWKQLQRWKLDADLLPPDALIINRPATLWSQYREYVIGSSLLIVLLLALVLLLLSQNRLRRSASDAIRRLNNELEDRVRARTADLQHAMEQLQLFQKELVQAEKLAALGAMVAGVAHELNTPIGNCLLAVSTQAEAVAQMRRALAEGMTRSSLERFLSNTETTRDIVERNIERAAELVASFKQVAVDRATSQRRRFRLVDVCDETIMTLGAQAKAAACEIIADIPGDLWLDSYPGPLGQVLSNLIGNALVHGFSQAVRGSVRVGASSADGWVRIEVADDGAGIAPELQGRVFDPFFTTRLGHGGSGLGLHIVHNLLVGVLGGRISLSSALGQGCRFTIELPCVAPQAGEAA